MEQICSRYVADMEQIYSRYGADMKQICSRYGAGMQQIWSRYAADMEQIWSRYAADMQIFIKLLAGFSIGSILAKYSIIEESGEKEEEEKENCSTLRSTRYSSTCLKIR